MTVLGHRSGLGASRASVDPGAHEFSQPRLRSGHRLASLVRLPSPGNQIVLGQMFMQKFEIASAVSVRVFELLANLADGFSLPGHFDGCRSPARMARDAFVRCTLHQRKVTISMARLAGTGFPKNWGLMWMQVISLGRTIVRRVAVHAPCTGDYLGGFRE